MAERKPRASKKNATPKKSEDVGVVVPDFLENNTDLINTSEIPEITETVEEEVVPEEQPVISEEVVVEEQPATEPEPVEEQPLPAVEELKKVEDSREAFIEPCNPNLPERLTKWVAVIKVNGQKKVLIKGSKEKVARVANMYNAKLKKA